MNKKIFKNKRIVLVGGAGFIGHNLAIHLKKRGADVSIIDNLQVNHLGEISLNKYNNSTLYLNFLYERLDLLRKQEIPLHVIDARDYSILCKQINLLKPNVLIHLAAVAHAQKANKDPYSTFDHSTRTLENTLDICRDKNIHFIYFSSSMVYGQFENESVSEESPCKPLGIYGALKFSGEKLVIAYNQVFDLKYTIIRPSALYGERCVSRRVSQVFIENSIKNNAFCINGTGEDSLDFTYINDLLNGVELIIKNKASTNQTFNLTYGKASKINFLAKVIKNYFPNVKITYEKKDKLMPERGTLDISKAKKLLSYNPKHNLEKGIEKYVNWYSKSFK